LPDDQTVEANDQQDFENTCGERVWVETLALAGVITPEQQADLAHELWDVVNPAVAGQYDAPGWGTSIWQMTDIGRYLEAKYPDRKIDMQPVYPMVGSINEAFRPGYTVMLAVRLDILRPDLHLPYDGHWLLGRSDTGQFVHYLDSCARIDFSPDVAPTSLFAQSCLGLVGSTSEICGWSTHIG
jgi:hypothetical protein